MRLSKFIIFRVKNQKFAIKTKQVINLLTHVRICETIDSQGNQKHFFKLNGIEVPFINFHQIVQPGDELKGTVPLALLIEVRYNNDNKDIIGISIDEIIEVTNIDDLITYPFMTPSTDRKFDFKESIIMFQNEPIIVLNTNTLGENQKKFNMLQNKIYLSN